jgi:radical SAM family uncharacterized protein/radical SAM-linked protein
MSFRDHPYSDFLHEVSKPARYVGGEHFSVVKDWEKLDATMALAFPDVYDIGMSHQGTKILYSIINKEDDLCLERVFCPWFDLDKELRERKLPLVSLETHRPLSEFDIVGFSLQYELTFTNILTMLDLSGIPLRNRDRRLSDPLIVAGGPVATQPEPMSPFIDVFVIGDAEERLPRLMRHYTALAREGELSRIEILAEIAKEGGVYCPDLYERELCERSGLMTVVRAKYPGVPERVQRAFLDDINKFPYPDDSPVPVAEAIFDRMSVEIARGCTEGCRFCQAGMIYRPVRERDPQQIVDTLVSAVEKGGYDEAAITSLSTADYSCISPLVKGVMAKLRPQKVSLGISSLRAYGLDEDLLDDIATVKATGLTFAPEAGTQRMRDVVNKNITEEDIYTTCHRVFSRGWSKIKLYFMIGLPTEQDEDVVGIAQMGGQARNIGREHQKRGVNVTVSVSSHVPKPHTPFQWAAQDSMDEIARKQALLAQASRRHGFKLKTHDLRVSHLEGIMARGDVRVAELIERAWRGGARFDGWDEHLDWNVWCESLDAWEQECDVSRETFLATLPIDGALPWDHIDVGLADGFLAMEYKRTLKGRFSPPCGKPVHAKVHHTNLEDARADERKLVCYHCGVACDLTGMREERLVFLEQMGATRRPDANVERGDNVRQSAHTRVERGLAPHDFAQGKPIRYRLRYRKTVPMSLRGHLDMVRVLPRVFRRAGLSLHYTEGFSPRPMLVFGPALALGMQSVAEYVDFALTEPKPEAALLSALQAASEEGLGFEAVRCLSESEPALSKRIDAISYLARLPAAPSERYAECLEAFFRAPAFPVQVTRKGKPRSVDAKAIVLEAVIKSAGTSAGLWDGQPSETVLELRVAESSGTPSLKPAELVKALLAVDVPPTAITRAGCWSRTNDGELGDPLEPVLEPLRAL